VRHPALALAMLTAACANPDAVVDPGDPTPIVFDVPKGASGQKVGDLLVEAGLVDSAFNWKMSLRQLDGSCVKAGKHELRRSMTLREILAQLCAAPIPDDVPFAVLEGWRIADIDAALAAKGWIAAGDYARVATRQPTDAPGPTLPFPIESPTLEGYLYPETYMVPPDRERFSATRLIERQLATFKERFLDEHHAAIAPRTLHEIVVVASMVEREEPTPKHRPIVAGIIYKRLDRGIALGIDATSRYKLKNWEDEKAFRAVLKDPADDYGTRVRVGLPPGAIGNPSRTALEAAVRPEPSEYLYYLHDRQGRFHGGRNAAEHEANRVKYGVW
jgi:UPF0755 protein